MDTYSFISENGTVHEIADLAAREKNAQQDETINTFDARINEAYQKASSVEALAQDADTKATDALAAINAVGGVSLTRVQVGTSPSGSPVYRQTWVFNDNDTHTLELGAGRTLVDVNILAKRLGAFIRNPDVTFSFTTVSQSFKGNESSISGQPTYYVTLSWVVGTF